MKDQNEENSNPDFESRIDSLFSELSDALNSAKKREGNSMKSTSECLGKMLSKITQERFLEEARSLSNIGIGVLMVVTGYLIDPKLQEKSTLMILSSFLERNGINALVSDLRSNGVEATFDQVYTELLGIIDFCLLNGLAGLQAALTGSGRDVSPPKSSKLDFDDIGIENPFKDSPEA